MCACVSTNPGTIVVPVTSMTSAPANRREAVVADDDVGILDDLVAAHGDRAATAQHGRAARYVTRRRDADAMLPRLVCGRAAPLRARGRGVARRRRLAAGCANAV